MGSFRNGASVGLFRHEDESFHPYFNEFVLEVRDARRRWETALAHGVVAGLPLGDWYPELEDC